MANQRRFAVQAPEPPHLVSASGRNSNSPTLFPWLLALPGAQTLARPSYASHNPIALAAGPAPRGRQIHCEASACAGVPAVQGATCPPFPLWSAKSHRAYRAAWAARGSARPFPKLNLGRSPVRARSSARPSMRDDCHLAVIPKGRNKQPAGTFSRQTPLALRIKNDWCRPVRGRTESQKRKRFIHTMEVETDVAPKAVEVSSVRQRTICR